MRRASERKESEMPIELEVCEEGIQIIGGNNKVWHVCTVCGKGRWVDAQRITLPSFTGLCQTCWRSGNRKLKGEKIVKVNAKVVEIVKGVPRPVEPEEPFLENCEGCVLKYMFPDCHNGAKFTCPDWQEAHGQVRI